MTQFMMLVIVFGMGTLFGVFIMCLVQINKDTSNYIDKKNT